MVWFESLAGNDFSDRGAQAEAHCERNLNRHCEVLDEKCRIAVQGIFVGIMIKASGAILEVTDLLFAFDFCKKINQESWYPRSLAVFN